MSKKFWRIPNGEEDSFVEAGMLGVAHGFVIGSLIGGPIWLVWVIGYFVGWWS